MIPIRDNVYSKNVPIVTWTIAALNVFIYLWDRGGALSGGPMAFSEFMLVPRDVVMALQGQGHGESLVTLFTSLFLHGNVAHLFFNMVMLLVFGDNVEGALGPVRFALYYLFWGLAASAAHIFVMPMSSVPVLGASGAIGGVLGAYLFMFPGNKVRVIVLPAFWWAFQLEAWIVLGIWILSQVFLPQEAVANWAHVGGFLAGMLTVLIMGGRKQVLKGKEFILDPAEVEP